MNELIDRCCAPMSACEPRKNTDVFFPLPSGSNAFSGALMDAIRFIEKVQLLDANLWRLFVNQFRQGNVDDHDRGWRCEYWGKLMRGGCFTYQATGSLTTDISSCITVLDRAAVFSRYAA